MLNVIPGSSTTASSVYFVANGVLARGATPGRCSRNPEGEPLDAARRDLQPLRLGSRSGPPRPAHDIASSRRSQAKTRADWGCRARPRSSRRSQRNLSAVTSQRLAEWALPGVHVERSLTGYDNRDRAERPARRGGLLYDAVERPAAVRLLQPGRQASGWQRPHGVFDTELAGEGVGLLVDRSEIWNERCLAGSLPGWSFNINGNSQPARSTSRATCRMTAGCSSTAPTRSSLPTRTARRTSTSTSPRAWAPATETGGCIGLISSGTSDRESAFLDASENGDDVFFVTAGLARVAPTPTTRSTSTTRMSARGRSRASHIRHPPRTECESAAACRPPSSDPPPAGTAPPSSTFHGPGNTPSGQVLPYKTATPPKRRSR